MLLVKNRLATVTVVNPNISIAQPTWDGGDFSSPMSHVAFLVKEQSDPGTMPFTLAGHGNRARQLQGTLWLSGVCH